jgi:hypothetical protein
MSAWLTNRSDEPHILQSGRIHLRPTRSWTLDCSIDSSLRIRIFLWMTKKTFGVSNRKEEKERSAHFKRPLTDYAVRKSLSARPLITYRMES